MPKEPPGASDVVWSRDGKAAAIVREVALTPDQTRLYLSIGAIPGGHNDPIRFHRGVFALPRGVLSSDENAASK